MKKMEDLIIFDIENWNFWILLFWRYIFAIWNKNLQKYIIKSQWQDIFTTILAASDVISKTIKRKKVGQQWL